MSLRTLTANGLTYGARPGHGIVTDGDIGMAKKRVIRASVPGRSGTYDFSEVCGRTYDDRTAKYTFGFVGSRDEVYRGVSHLAGWLYDIQDADIWDSDVPYWHMHGTCDEVAVEYDESGEGADVTATITAEPHLYADDLSSLELEPGQNHVFCRYERTPLLAYPSGSATLSMGGASKVVSSPGSTGLFLEPGLNIVTLAGACTIKWREMRL